MCLHPSINNVASPENTVKSKINFSFFFCLSVILKLKHVLESISKASNVGYHLFKFFDVSLSSVEICNKISFTWFISVLSPLCIIIWYSQLIQYCSVSFFIIIAYPESQHGITLYVLAEEGESLFIKILNFILEKE